MSNTKLINVDWDTYAYFFVPPNEWSVLDDCGSFPCTGPLNVLIDFRKTTFSGSIVPLKTASNFQLISGDPENSGAFATCKRFDAWNGFYCNNDQLAIVTFESFDDDKYKRILSPI
jgi:hypothetical protein